MENIENLTLEELKAEYVELEKKYTDLKLENIELTRFVSYVKNLRTHEDFNRLRNIILQTNKKFKNK